MRKTTFIVPNLFLLTFLVWSHSPSSVVTSQSDEKRAIASIDFFGYGHFDVVKLQSVLPIKAGESIQQSEWTAYRSRIDEAIRSETRKPPTDVAFLCCNERGDSMIYIGVAGTSSVAVTHKPAPMGKGRLPAAAFKLSHETEEASKKAVLAGRTATNVPESRC